MTASVGEFDFELIAINRVVPTFTQNLLRALEKHADAMQAVVRSIKVR
jgi:hypothetical protein